MPVPDAYRAVPAGTVGRSAFYSLTLNAGQEFSALQNTQYAPFLGLDLAIQNVSGGPAVVTIDGKAVNVPIGGVELTNLYFDQIKVLSAGSDGGLNLTMDGILRSDLDVTEVAA